jgi:hypothetical protein
MGVRLFFSELPAASLALINPASRANPVDPVRSPGYTATSVLFIAEVGEAA